MTKDLDFIETANVSTPKFQLISGRVEGLVIIGAFLQPCAPAVETQRLLFNLTRLTQGKSLILRDLML